LVACRAIFRKISAFLRKIAAFEISVLNKLFVNKSLKKAKLDVCVVNTMYI